PGPAVQTASNETLRLATIEDPEGTSVPDDFTVTVDWGDGNITSAIVAATSPITFDVLGSHPYSAVGSYSVQVTVSKAGIAPQIVSTSIDVAAHMPLQVSTQPLVLNGQTASSFIVATVTN